MADSTFPPGFWRRVFVDAGIYAAVWLVVYLAFFGLVYSLTPRNCPAIQCTCVGPATKT